MLHLGLFSLRAVWSPRPCSFWAQLALEETLLENLRVRESALAAALAPPKPRYLQWEHALEEEVLRIDVVRSVKVALQRGIKDQAPDFNKHKHTEVGTMPCLHPCVLWWCVSTSGGRICFVCSILCAAAPCVVGHSHGWAGGGC